MVFAASDLLIGRRFLCYRNTSAGGDGAGVGCGFGYEVGFEVFDEAVVVGVVVLEMPEAVGEVEFAIARYGFVEVDHKSFADGDVFDVHDRGISAHLGKDVVQAVGAGIDLAQGFKVVDVVHDQAQVGRSDAFDHLAACFRVFEDGDEVGFHDDCDAVLFEGRGDFSQGFDEAFPCFWRVVLAMGCPASSGVAAAGTQKIGLCR